MMVVVYSIIMSPTVLLSATLDAVTLNELIRICVVLARNNDLIFVGTVVTIFNGSCQ